MHYDYNTAEKMGTVQRVTMMRSTEEMNDGDNVYVSGWGRNPDNSDTEDDLYQVNLKMVNSTHCARMWGFSEGEMEKHHFCATGKHGRDACQGDSGGPLMSMKTHRQIGVVSFGARCRKNPNKLPGVYTSIKDNMQWIRSTMRRN